MRSEQQRALLRVPRTQAEKAAAQPEILLGFLHLVAGLALLYEILTGAFYGMLLGLPIPQPPALTLAELTAALVCVLNAVVKLVAAWVASSPGVTGETDRLLHSLSERQAQLLGVSVSDGISIGNDAPLSTPEFERSSSSLRYRSQFSARGLPPKCTPVASHSSGQTWGSGASQTSTMRRRSLLVSPKEVSAMVESYAAGLKAGDKERDELQLTQREDFASFNQQLSQQNSPPLAYAAYDGSMQQLEMLLWRHSEAQDPYRTEAQQLLTKLEMVRSVEELTDRTRKFLGQRLRRYVLRLKWVIDELEKRGIMRELLEHERKRQPQFRIPGDPQRMLNLSSQDIIHRCSERDGSVFVTQDPESGNQINLLWYYQKVERVLQLNGEPAYVLQRLRTLSDDGYLGSYRWDSGGRHRGRDWSPDLPTDAEIVMHVFCCWGDDLLPGNYAQDQPFVQKHFFEGDESSLDNLAGKFLLVRTNSHGQPPHYRVVANGEKWHVAKGRLNVFQSVMLFLYAIKKLKSGYLSNINLNHDVLDDIFAVDYAD